MIPRRGYRELVRSRSTSWARVCRWIPLVPAQFQIGIGDQGGLCPRCRPQSRYGKAIIALPKNNGRRRSGVSRIVLALAPGTAVTTHARRYVLLHRHRTRGRGSAPALGRASAPRRSSSIPEAPLLRRHPGGGRRGRRVRPSGPWQPRTKEQREPWHRDQGIRVWRCCKRRRPWVPAAVAQLGARGEETHANEGLRHRPNPASSCRGTCGCTWSRLLADAGIEKGIFDELELRHPAR